MIKISYDNEMLQVQCNGKDFNDQIESVKYLGMQYESTLKLWQTGVGRYDEIIQELVKYKIDISEYDKQEIANYFESIDELKVISQRSNIRKFKQDLLKVPPIKDFQLIDISTSLNRNRFGFHHATGLGKSYCLAALLSHLRHYGEVHKAIILTSPIGILNLSNELKKFIVNYDETKTLIINSITHLKDRLVFDQDWDIIICGYDTFRSIGDAYDKAINKRTKKVKYRKSMLPLAEWFGDKKGLIFMDECHLLGSPTSLRSKFIAMNLHHFEYRYLMSATMSDKNEKLYMTLKILNNKLINGLDYHSWLSQYCTLGNKWSKYGVNAETWDYQKWAILQDELYRNYIVKRGKELLGLKPAYDVPLIHVNMSPKHRDIYESFSYQVIEDIKKRSAINNAGLPANLTNTFQYLQLAVDNPMLLLSTPSFSDFSLELQQKIQSFDFEKDFAKLEILDSIVEEECIENDNKILISYYHPITLQCLEKHFKKGYHVVSAETPKEERLGKIEAFKKSKDKILIASINVMNSSFTLTEAKAEVFFERTWAYIPYEQFRGRIYRIGQDDEVRYYNMSFNNSIDNLQLRALETKGKVVENIAQKNILTPDEWKLIFNANEDISF